MEIKGYKILEKIGQGGMAQVYKGYQLSLKRPVAIKVLTHSFTDQADFIQRFEKESLIIARLSNPFIIPVIERGISQSGIPYFIMEYVDGHELGNIMGKGQLDFNRKLDISTQICKALSYAHRNNVVHRDIKPANILIDTDGNARILDFGIAQYYDDKEVEQANEQTKVGTILGTIAYMSPEQRRSATQVTFKSDLYSLGVLMYKMFTHHDPIGRFKSPEELEPEIPHQLSHIILQCLATEPSDRPSSADEIKDILLLLLRGAHLQTEQRERVQQDFRQFDLLDVIKEDQHSAVLLFQNHSSNKLIVIKKRALGDAGFEEAKLLTPLKHPNIVNILGTSKNQRNYIIVMEYLNGGSLQERLVQAMKWQEFIPLALEIAAGMLFAHNNRILHGNLRPSNILFDNAKHIKIADFGLQEHYSKKQQENNWYRLAEERISPKLDIFSIGAIFYQMLVGIPPALDEQRFESNNIFKKLPLKLKQLISQMLRIEPQERIENFSRVAYQLDEIMAESGATVVIKNKQPGKKVKKPAPKIRYALYLLVIITLLLILAYFFVDLQEMQYFIEDIFSPPDEDQEKQFNFIELTLNQAHEFRFI